MLLLLSIVDQQGSRSVCLPLQVVTTPCDNYTTRVDPGVSEASAASYQGTTESEDGLV